MKKSNPIPYLKRLTDVFEWGNSNHQSYYHALKCWFSHVCAMFIRAVRSLRGRDEVDTMAGNSLRELEKNDEVVRASLDEIFNLPDSYPQEMKESWDQTGLMFLDEFFNDSENDVEFFKRRIEAINIALSEIEKFETKYSDFFTDREDSSFIICRKNLLISERKLSSSFYSLYRESISNSSSEESIKSISNWFLDLRYNVIEFLQDKRFPDDYISHLIEKINVFSSNEIVEAIKKDYLSNIRDLASVEPYLSVIDESVMSLRNFNDHLREIVAKNQNRLIFESIEDVEHQDLQSWLASLPETDDHWLDDCPEAKSSIERGLAQASQGRGEFLGSFANYLDLDDSD